MRKFIGTGVSYGALIVAMSYSLLTQAQAQAASTQEQSAKNGGGAIEQVVVTANKARQLLQKAPLAVTAISGSNLVTSGVKDLQDIQSFAPSVRFQEEGVIREIYLRGIGSTNDISTLDPPNAFNFNGVYLQREATGVSLFDIQDVEVVPGPQNTLYGRSALGGTVNVTAKKPVDYFESDGVLELGNYSEVNATGVLNVPLTNDLYVRLAYNHLSHAGYETTGADDRNEDAGRPSLLWKPNSHLTVYLWGTVDHQGGHGSNLVNRGRDPVTGQATAQFNDSFLRSDPWNDTIPAAYNPFAPVRPYPRKYDFYAAGGELDYDFGWGVLTYIPGYTKLNMDNRYTFTAIPLIQIKHSHEMTQELRLSSPEDSDIKWLIGLYGYQFHSQGHLYAFATAPANDLYHDPHSDSHGIALFGQITYPITKHLHVTAGGRLSSDHRHVFGFDTPNPYDHAKTFKNIDVKAGVDYDFTKNSMVYANFQTGSQLGTFDTRPGTPTSPALVKSPTLKAYTVGSKNRLWGGRLEVDDEFFFYDYKNFVVSAFDAHGGGITTNAKRYLIYGNDLKVVARVTPDDQLDATIGYLHARYDRFVTLSPPPGTTTTNFAGVQGQYAPDWTVTVGYQHAFELPNQAELIARVDSHYESSFAAAFYHPLGGTQSPYTKTNVSVTYYSADGRWSLGMWAKNLENAAVEAASATGAVPGPVGTFLAPPRTFGARFTIHTE